MSSKSYWDAHCHLADPKFSEGLMGILDRSEKAGVNQWLQGGIGPEDWEEQKKISRFRPHRIHLAFGLHPWWVATHDEGEIISALKKLESELPQAVCLGELGLDYMPKFLAKAQLQQEVFRAQLLLNARWNKPLVLHVVRAHEDALSILRAGPSKKGLVHAFSENRSVLKKYLDLGFLISVGDAVRKQGYQKLKETLQFIPLERLVVETDACGGPTEPADLVAIASVISEMRGDISPEALLENSAENLQSLLGPYLSQRV
ncbi:TatD family deoxyribonuclease [bacterium]|nr:TatD family deoxyribonuclease [bacterium]